INQYSSVFYTSFYYSSPYILGILGLSGPYGPSLPAVPAWVRVPRFDGFGKIVDDEDDECNPVNFFDGIDRTHVRSMTNRKIPLSGGLADIRTDGEYFR